MPANVKDMLANFKYMTKESGLDQETYDKLYNKYFKYAEHPLIAPICDIVAGLGEDIKTFKELMSNTLSKDQLNAVKGTTHPLVVLSPKIDHFLVYPNLLTDNQGAISDLNILDVSSIKTLVDQYEKEIHIDGAKEKWASVDRVKKRLLETLEVPTARALARYLNLDDGTGTQARDLATKIDTARKPMELLFADTPEDFLVMYGPNGPPSCMSHTGQAAWAFMEKVGMTATSFYAYFPYTRGAYLMKNGKVFARVVLYTNADQDTTDMGYPTFNKAKAKIWHYGYPYSSTGDHTELKKALASHGIKPMANSPKGNHFVPPEGYSFEIPGINMNLKANGANGVDYGCPFPFFDNMDYRGTGFCAEFDPTTKMFKITYKAGQGSVPANNRNGYLHSMDYVQKRCEHCGSTTSTKWITTHDGHLYDTRACAEANNYTQIYNGAGENWIKKEHIDNSYVPTDDGKLFTNIKAAEQHDYYMPIGELGNYPEEGTLVRMYGVGDRLIGDIEGKHYLCSEDKFLSNTIPVNIVNQQKVVVFDPDKPLVAAA